MINLQKEIKRTNSIVTNYIYNEINNNLFREEEKL